MLEIPRHHRVDDKAEITPGSPRMKPPLPKPADIHHAAIIVAAGHRWDARPLSGDGHHDGGEAISGCVAAADQLRPLPGRGGGAPVGCVAVIGFVILGCDRSVVLDLREKIWGLPRMPTRILEATIYGRIFIKFTKCCVGAWHEMRRGALGTEIARNQARTSQKHIPNPLILLKKTGDWQ